MFIEPVNGCISPLKAQVTAAHPVMLRLKTVKTHGNRVKTCIHQFIYLFTGKQHTVGNHSPQISALLDLSTHLDYILTHQRFTASGNDYASATLKILWTAVQYAQKVTHGRIFQPGSLAAVTSAVAAAEVTT